MPTLSALSPVASPWLLDGPTGTELERRGYGTRLPLWTALAARDCPDLLRNIHYDYASAGADVLTACTFRTSRHSLAKAGRAADAHALTRDAVALARDAAAAALVAGSVAPLEDCYFPDRTPDDRVLTQEHSAHISSLVDAGVDLLLIETMSTLRESIVAARIAASTGLPFILSWVVGDRALLLDGTPLDACLDAVRSTGPAVVSVNCASTEACTDAIPILASGAIPFGAYANSGAPDGSFGFTPSPLDTERYADAVSAWLDAGASMVGGCCGTTPLHIARLRALIDQRARRVAARGPR